MNAVQIEDMLIADGHCAGCGDLNDDKNYDQCIAILTNLVNGYLDDCDYSSEFDDYAFEGC